MNTKPMKKTITALANAAEEIVHQLSDTIAGRARLLKMYENVDSKDDQDMQLVVEGCKVPVASIDASVVKDIIMTGVRAQESRAATLWYQMQSITAQAINMLKDRDVQLQELANGLKSTTDSVQSDGRPEEDRQDN